MRIQWWTDIGHKKGKRNREKTWLWAYDKQGKLQVINEQDLHQKLVDKGNYAGIGIDHRVRATHLDWEMFIPGLLAGAAHGRIDATEGVIRVSLAGRISDDTFRQQVKQELAEYIGADVDKVKGYDFTGDGMPEVFEPGDDYEVRDDDGLPVVIKWSDIGYPETDGVDAEQRGITNKMDSDTPMGLFFVSKSGEISTITLQDLAQRFVSGEGSKDPNVLKYRAESETDPDFLSWLGHSQWIEIEDKNLRKSGIFRWGDEGASMSTIIDPYKALRPASWGRYEMRPDGSYLMSYMGHRDRKLGRDYAKTKLAEKLGVGVSQIAGFDFLKKDKTKAEYNGWKGSNGRTYRAAQVFEPGAAYGDAENMPIPGGAREAQLKAAGARKSKAPLYYTEIGHDPDNAQNSYMFVVGPDGVMQVMRVSDLRTEILSQYSPDDNNIDELTHTDWETATRIGSSKAWNNAIAFGRIEVKDGKPYIAIGAKGDKGIEMVSMGAGENIQSVVRDAAQALIDSGKITGVTQRAVGIDFSADNDSGNPEVFEPGEERRLFSQGSNRSLPSAAMSKEEVIAAAEEIFGRDVVKALIDSGLVVFAEGNWDQDLNLTFQEQIETSGAQGWAEKGKTYIMADMLDDKAQVKAIILHELGQHLGFGDDIASVQEFFFDMRERAAGGDKIAQNAVRLATWAMLMDGRFKGAVSKIAGGKFSKYIKNARRYQDFGNFDMSDAEIDQLMDEMLNPAGNWGDDFDRKAFAGVLMEEVGATRRRPWACGKGSWASCAGPSGTSSAGSLAWAPSRPPTLRSWPCRPSTARPSAASPTRGCPPASGSASAKPGPRKPWPTRMWIGL